MGEVVLVPSPAAISGKKPSSEAGPQRKRRWVSRAKTGCNTCRTRRIRCDEARPICKRCVVAKRPCTGDGYDNGEQARLALIKPQKGLDPLDWDFKQACQYYCEVQAPMERYGVPGGSTYDYTYDAQMHLSRRTPEPWSFTMIVLQHRILCSAAANMTPPAYSHMPTMHHIWHKLYEHMSMSLKLLNQHIISNSRPGFVMGRIVDLLGTELGLSIPTWRAHAEGMAATIKAYGGVKNLMTVQRPPVMQVQFGLVVSTACNATSPPLDQITGMANWSREEYVLTYSHTGFEALPCPTVLFLEMIEISRLRTKIATTTIKTHHAIKARKIAQAVLSFDIETWKEPHDITGPRFALAGKLFKTALTLYAIMSFPRRLAAAFTTASRTGAADASSRVTDKEIVEARCFYRDQLFDLYSEAWTVLTPRSLGWLAAVLGAAAVDNAEQQCQVLRWLGELCRLPANDGGPLNLMSLLPEFWASGRTGWDDCFYKPTSRIV